MKSADGLYMMDCPFQNLITNQTKNDKGSTQEREGSIGIACPALDIDNDRLMRTIDQFRKCRSDFSACTSFQEPQGISVL